MERIFSRKNLCIAVYSVVFFIVFALCFEKFGNLFIDTGRELYTPFAMANFGTVLFKDIICIYGPLPYIFNALLVKIFGSSFALFNCIGGFLAFSFGLLFFFLSNKFLNEINSLILTFVVLSVSIFGLSSIFNFIVPYSYAMLYAAFFALHALVLSIKYIETKSPKYFIFSSFFVSLAVFSKYDFAILLLPLIVLAFYIKPSKETFVKALCAFFLPFLFAASYFIFNEVSLSDILQNFHYISNMAKAPSLKHFYFSSSGFLPNFKRFSIVFPKALQQIFIFLCPIFCLIVSKISKNKFLSSAFKFFAWVSIAFAGFFLLFFFKAKHSILCYFTLIFAIFFLIEFVKFLKQKTELSPKIFLYFFCLLFSIKSLFYLLVDSYGAFFFPFVILPLALILKKYLKIAGEFYPLIKKYLTGVAVAFVLVFLFCNFNVRVFPKLNAVSTPQGKFYVYGNDNETLKSLFEIIESENPDNELILGLPEGLFFNFILKNNYKIYPTSFIPLDFDAYGEEFLAKNVMNANPKIIFFTPRDCGEYGKHSLCVDFGEEFCSVVLDNYDYRGTLGENDKALRFAVYVRKK